MCIRDRYTYYVTETLNGCEGASVPVTLEIYNSSTLPSAINETVCEGTPIPDLTAVGSNLTWYSDIALSNTVGTGTIFSTPNIAAGLYTYYVTSNNSSGCESAALPVTLEIFNSSLPPTTINETVCEGAIVPDLTASGSNITWYSDTALTNVVGTGNNFTSLNTSVGTYTYYATSNNLNGCESSSSTAILSIDPTPVSPNASNVNACFGSNIPLLTANGTGSNFNWYDDILLNNLISSNNPFNTTQTNPGLYTYYVTEILNGCESSPHSVVLEIYTNPNTGPINHW